MHRFMLGLILAVTTHAANAACLSIVGTVELTPDAQCTIVGEYAAFDPGVPFVGPSTANPEDFCFRADLRLGGVVPATGYAGVTAEGAQSLMQGSQQREVLTARSTFTVARTKFYAAEVFIQTGDVVTEQSVILGTNGRGLFRNSTGFLHILGDSTAGQARVIGEICSP